ncbi:MAG TPA: hypothetical protein V6D23_01580 [Candidatus Obscuribacterales bacterium]
MYAATVHGVRKSTDGGLSWVPTGYTYQADTVAVAFSDPNVVYASEGDVWKSTNGGDTWTQIKSQAGAEAYIGLAVSPVDANLVLAGTFRSTDGGDTWSPNGLTGYIRKIMFTDANTVYASNYSQGLFKSTDAGVNWTLIATQGVNGFGGQCGVPYFDVDKSNPDHIVAAAYGLVHYTFDGGAHWISSGFSGYYIAIDPSNPNVVYASNYAYGISRSINGGVSFQTFSTGLIQSNYYAVLVNPSGRAYAASSDAGPLTLPGVVFRTNN